MGSQVSDETTPLLRPDGRGAHDLAVFPEALRGKRIMLCTESFGPVNGVSRTTLMLVNHLRSHGADVAVVAPQNHTRHNTFTPKTLAGDGSVNGSAPRNLEVRLSGYPLPVNPELTVVYPVRLSTLYARTFGAPPDLIYLASPASLGFQVMLQHRQQPGNRPPLPPILCNFQTDLAGYCAILFPEPLASVAVATFDAVQGYLFRGSGVRGVLYPSRAVQRYLAARGVDDGKMLMVQRGVDTEMFAPSKRREGLRKEIVMSSGGTGDEIILVCVARIAGEKGFAFLAQVAEELDERGLKFKLYIVGGNRNAAVEAEVKELFAGLVARGRVIFAGFRVGEELAAAYASADLFLHCSITETFGLVVLESMASGVPVVARDEGGPSDIVRDGHTGYLVPPNDLNGFVDKVMLLATDDALRGRFSTNARLQAEDATWEKINNKVAWRIADAIDEAAANSPRQDTDESKSLLGKAKTALVRPVRPVFQSIILEVKTLLCLAIITIIWAFVAVYLAFIKLTHFIRNRGGSQ
jgi:glycosyltransferase involved in cell wall biosynthesis